MDRSETVKLMAVLNAAYPNFYRNTSREDALAAIDLWTNMFAEEPYDVVNTAVRMLIRSRSSTFPPVIGEVTEQIYRLRHPDEISDDDAWRAVRRAIGNGLYGSQEEFDRLPEPVQRCVGSPSQLRDWAMMSVEELDSVVASNFRRAFRARNQSAREYDALPGDVRQLLTETTGKLFKALPGGDT